MPPVVARVKKKAGLVKCRCKSHCTVLNPSTGRYHGDGEFVTASTMSRHKKDDRLRKLFDSDNTPHQLQPQIPTEYIATGSNLSPWFPLIRAEVDSMEDLPCTTPSSPLLFVNNPQIIGPYEPEWYSPINYTGPGLNLGRHALLLGHPANRLYLHRENRLYELIRLLQTETSTEAAELKISLSESLQLLEREKETHWTSQRGVQAGSVLVYNSEGLFQRRGWARDETIITSSIISIVMHHVHFLPRRATEIQLAGLRDILTQFGPVRGEDLAKALPKIPKTLSARFSLDPVTTTYISCASCHCLYNYDPIARNVYASTCTHRKTPSSEPCGEDLWEDCDYGPYGVVKKPKKKYLHQGLQPWLARLLSRSDIEDMVDRVRSDSDDEEVSDIWSSQVFQSLQDESGEKFFPGPEEELRLIFSLSVDSFNPFHNKTAKQTASSTGIWMVLLNLPREARYLPENMYLAGVIPGPSKPSNEQINHYLKLVVNDFKSFWHPGVRFTRTFKHRFGRLAKAMVVPVVCDLLGARQVIGYAAAPSAHYFCTVCDLDIDDIEIIDRAQWPAKSESDIRVFAQRYRDASDEKEQAYIFQASGWRWSPLFELEYWKPSLFTVVDSMHSLDLNLLGNHCRNLLKIDLKVSGGEALRPGPQVLLKRITDNNNELQALDACQDAIFDNSTALLDLLLTFHRRVLYSFCLDYDVRDERLDVVVGTKLFLAKNIVSWRQRTDPNSTVHIFLNRYPRLSLAQEELSPGRQKKKGREQDASEATSRSNTGDIQDSGSLNAPLPLNTPSESSAFPGVVSEDEAVGIAAGNWESQSRERRPDPESQLPEVDVWPKLPSRTTLRNFANHLISFNSSSSEEAKKFYGRINKSTLQYFCHIIGEDVGGLSGKQAIYEHCIQTLNADEEKQVQLIEALSEDLKVLQEGAAFLGKDVMEAVWSDMKLTRLPLWITPPPHDWGTPGRGKLSANNWRVICCIHLPITLIRLYGKESGRKKKILDNFMVLVAAIRCATRAVTSPQHIESYNSLIQQYTSGVKELFPDYHILPSHHGALHIGDMLQRFGPKHAHDSPHYERYINFFHRMNNNNKLGDLEGTLLRTAVRCANTVALMKDNPGLLSCAENMITSMKRVEEEQLRGFRLAELFNPQIQTAGRPGYLDDYEYHEVCAIVQHTPTERNAIISRRALFMESITHKNAIYSTWKSKRYRDSGILYHDHELRQLYAASISSIFEHRHQPTTGAETVRHFLVVEAYNKIDEASDPYRQYGSAAGFLCEITPTQRKVIALPQVKGHVTRTDFQQEGWIHFLPVSRELLSLEEEDNDDAGLSEIGLS